MDNDVSAVLDGPAKHRCRHGVVDDKRYAMVMSDPSEGREIRHVACRIPNALAEDRAGIIID